MYDECGGIVIYYRLIRTQHLPEYDAIAYYYEHRKSGAHIFHLSNKDPENLFAFCFATPPSDSTGIAHILEHTVLCGSKRFPLKDPFLQLLKGSVHSFLNAMTFPDRTIYPAASALQRDLLNMMFVYGDAVFYPRLQREMFMQEGHHLKFDEQGKLETSGVVYNEMIGANSTHEHVASEWSYRGLLPDTVYRHSSGGDPKKIVDLDYRAFVDFHRVHYHPAQSLIFLYGNISTPVYLRFLHQKFLRRFRRLSNRLPDIPVQKHWKRPRSMVKTFPYVSDISGQDNSSVTISWLLNEVRSGYDIILIEVMSEVLIGNSGSPLYKAILESPLGEDLAPSSGVETEIKQLFFSVGIRGTREEHKAKVETLIYDTLRTVVKQGIDPVLLEGALFKIEFSIREVKSLQGLRILRRIIPGWLYQDDPYQTISVEQALSALKAERVRNPRIIEDAIQHQLLNNNHALTLVVNPDSEQATREKKTFTRKLKQREQSMTTEEKSSIVADHTRMTTLQNTPETPKQLARIPRLKISDMSNEPRIISYEEVVDNDFPVLHVPCHTNDIAYLIYAFDISHLTSEQLMYLPILTTVLTEIGTQQHNYSELSQLIHRYFGGLNISVEFHTDIHNQDRVRFSLIVCAKTLMDKVPEAMKLLTELLTETDFSQYGRYQQLLTEDINETKSSIIPAAHVFAGRSAASRLSVIGNVKECWSGVSQLKFLQTISEEQHLKTLQQIYHDIVGHSMLAAIGAKQEQLADLHSAVLSLNHALHIRSASISSALQIVPSDNAVRQVSDDKGQNNSTNTARFSARNCGPALYTIPSGGNYVGYAFSSSRLTQQNIHNYAAESVLARTLSTGVLWEQIRMQGGAYGASASVGIVPGSWCFVSYRDPHVERTIQEFEKALEYAVSGKISKAEIEQTLVAITGGETQPVPPEQRVKSAFMLYMNGRTEQLQRDIYHAYRNCSLLAVAEAATRLRDSARTKHAIAVIGEEASIVAAQKTYSSVLPSMEMLPL